MSSPTGDLYNLDDVTMETKDEVTTDFYSFTMYYLLKSLLVYVLFFILQGLRLRNEVFLVSPTVYPVEVPGVNIPGRVEVPDANSVEFSEDSSVATSESTVTSFDETPD